MVDGAADGLGHRVDNECGCWLVRVAHAEADHVAAGLDRLGACGGRFRRTDTVEAAAVAQPATWRVPRSPRFRHPDASRKAASGAVLRAGERIGEALEGVDGVGDVQHADVCLRVGQVRLELGLRFGQRPRCEVFDLIDHRREVEDVELRVVVHIAPGGCSDGQFGGDKQASAFVSGHDAASW